MKYKLTSCSQTCWHRCRCRWCWNSNGNCQYHERQICCFFKWWSVKRLMSYLCAGKVVFRADHSD